MRNKLIAVRYAKAVLDNIENSKYAEFKKDIELLKQLFTDKPRYISIIDSLLYPTQKRIESARLLSDKLLFSKIWQNLFFILIKKHRFSIILDILQELNEMILAFSDKVEVSIKIAHKHSQAVIEQISSIIQEILKKEVELKIATDPEIIGGFIASTNTVLIDGSIKNNLAKLANVKKI